MEEAGAHVDVVTNAIPEGFNLVELGSTHMKVLVAHADEGTLCDSGRPSVRRPLAHGQPGNVATNDYDPLVLRVLEHRSEGWLNLLGLLRNDLLQGLRVIDANCGECVVLIEAKDDDAPVALVGKARERVVDLWRVVGCGLDLNRLLLALASLNGFDKFDEIPSFHGSSSSRILKIYANFSRELANYT